MEDNVKLEENQTKLNLFSLNKELKALIREVEIIKKSLKGRK